MGQMSGRALGKWCSRWWLGRQLNKILMMKYDSMLTLVGSCAVV
jgi:hypothetical protein